MYSNIFIKNMKSHTYVRIRI